MTKHVVESSNAPKAIGSYSPAIRVGQLVFVSGQIPLDPVTMQIVKDDIPKQVAVVIKNLEAILKECGSDLEEIVKLTVFLTDIKNFEIVNQVMSEKFRSPYPARSLVGVDSLPKGASIEMDAIAYLDNH
ncbi:MAG: reactive intermediate/imine deaminase [Acidiferrobacteraceae bacterium]|nr:reactive intermediate/imine deaminase [Acidiferrobacteraceae bacterium]